ncbi:MAG: YkvA family protein [bacterium]|nr:YkvA family protein [bacterium]
MKRLKYLKEKARKIKSDITTLFYAYKNPKTKLLPKIIIFITLGYALSPVDLIPDFIPVLGYLDDLLIVPSLIALSIKLIPKDIMDESKEKALKEPVRLKDNWLFGSIFILVWILLLTFIVIKILKLFSK